MTATYHPGPEQGLLRGAEQPLVWWLSWAPFLCLVALSSVLWRLMQRDCTAKSKTGDGVCLPLGIELVGSQEFSTEQVTHWLPVS